MSTLTQSAVQTYTIDQTHSGVGFMVRHLGFSKVRGRFEQFAGTIQMTPGDLSTLSADVTIQADSITTNDEKRDAHLRSADFFEVETYPTLTFKSTSATAKTDDTFTLTGTLTLHGVTKTVELNGELLGTSKDPWGNTKAGFEATTEIDRKEFGLTWNAALEAGGFLVSDTVKITLELQTALQSA